MFLRFRASLRTYIYAFVHMHIRARAKKACKGTTIFSYDQIFLKENSKKMHFCIVYLTF